MPAAPAIRTANPLSAVTFGMVSAINTLGFGFAIMALMFNSPTASGYGMGVDVWVLSNVILAPYTAWRDQLPGAVGIVQEAGIPLIAGVPTPYVLARKAAGNEVRANLAVGGVLTARALSARDAAIAAALGPFLAARGLDLVGLDIIGDHLTEINVTSAGMSKEMLQQTGVHLGATLLDLLEARARAR